MKWALKNSERILANPKSKAKCPICNDEVISKCGSIKIWHWSHKSNKDCDDWYEPETDWHLNWKNEFTKECQEVTIKKCVSDYCYEEKYGHNHPDEYNHGDCVDCEFISHRADIKTKDGVIIELQNSSISPENIIERENYYKRMIWLLNGSKLAKGLELRKKDKLITFRWKHPPKSWWFSKKEVYIDCNESVKELKNRLKEYNSGKKKHQSPIYEEVWNEYMGYYYDKISGYIEDTKYEIKRIKEKIIFLNNKIFLIKKIYHNCPCGGWGILISKQDFLNKFRGKNNGEKRGAKKRNS